MAQTLDDQSISGRQARDWWRALLSNVVDLIEDADALLERKSYARARSLVILASEELARAVWLDRLASATWLDEGSTVVIPVKFWKDQKDHRAKLREVEDYAVGLAYFWSSTEVPAGPIPTPRDLGHRAAQLNLNKMAGFYVEADAKGIHSPADVPADGIQDHLRRVAGAAEMLIIQDHSRMKYGPGPYDSVQDLQMGLMPYSHPEEFADFLELMEARNDEN
jgi:AbiV family abortive infection protein